MRPISFKRRRCWTIKFGPQIAKNLRRRRPALSSRWHLDEMLVTIGGERMWLWRNTEEVQGGGDFALFDTLFADDHTPQPGVSADKDGVRILYRGLRAAFPDFHAKSIGRRPRTTL